MRLRGAEMSLRTQASPPVGEGLVGEPSASEILLEALAACGWISGYVCRPESRSGKVEVLHACEVCCVSSRMEGRARLYGSRGAQYTANLPFRMRMGNPVDK